MSGKTSSLWRVLDARWDDTDPGSSAIAVLVQGPGPADYAISCAGPKGMSPDQFITALRAGTAALIRSAGGDMSVVGGAPDTTFDTGDQRAN